MFRVVIHSDTNWKYTIKGKEIVKDENGRCVRKDATRYRDCSYFQVTKYRYAEPETVGEFDTIAKAVAAIEFDRDFNSPVQQPS